MAPAASTDTSPERGPRGNPAIPGPLRAALRASGEGGSPEWIRAGWIIDETGCRCAPPALPEALNRSGAEELNASRAMPLSTEDGKAPEWIHVTPAGPQLNGEDGRVFRMPDPGSVARESLLDAEGRHRDRVLDWEHATQRKGREGERAPAAGWITALQSRADGIWGRVEWTKEGRRSVEDREYRFVSPVLGLQPGTLEVRQIKSVALTNDPNLPATALNRAGAEGGESAMDEKLTKLLKRIAAALGMNAGTADADAVEAQCRAIVQERDEALNRTQSPPLAEFVPRGDYDAALNRASQAEAALADREKADLDGKIETAIEKALADGKITPATREYHERQCRSEGGLEAFEAFCEAAPEIAGGGGGSARPPEASNRSGSDSPEARRVRRLFGNKRKDVDKYAPGETS